MRTKHLFLLSVCFVFLSHCKKKSDSECTPPRSDYSFSEGKKISLIDWRHNLLPDTVQVVNDSIYRYYVAGGNSLVFKYDYYYEDCPGRIDGGGMQTIVFQIPGGLTSFNLSDSNSLLQSKALVYYSCGECFAGVRFLTNGHITGNKLSDNNWLVEASLSSPQFPSRSYVTNTIFKKE